MEISNKKIFTLIVLFIGEKSLAINLREIPYVSKNIKSLNTIFDRAKKEETKPVIGKRNMIEIIELYL